MFAFAIFYQRAYVARLLADPAHFTRIQGSKLWQLTLLEWWLQVHVDGVTLGHLHVHEGVPGLIENAGNELPGRFRLLSQRLPDLPTNNAASSPDGKH